MKLKTEIDFQFFFEENENSYSDLVTHQIAWCYISQEEIANIIITKSKIFILLPITLILYF
jgi:hypothetical protein